MTPERITEIKKRHSQIALYPMPVKLNVEGAEDAVYIESRIIEQEEALEYAYELIQHRNDIPALLLAVESLQAHNARLRAALVQARDEVADRVAAFRNETLLAAIDAALEDAQ